MSANEWASVLIHANKSREDKVPAGWKTRRELEKEWGLSQAYTLQKVNQLKATGKIEERRFKISTARGIYPTHHYRIKK